MSQSSILQRIASQYMSLAHTDLLRLAGDMAQALPAHEMSMPAIETVKKVAFCGEPGVTPHLTVEFIAKNGAEYFWDLSVKVKKLHEFGEMEPTTRYFFYGSLTLMKTPQESMAQNRPTFELPWSLQQE